MIKLLLRFLAGCSASVEGSAAHDDAAFILATYDVPAVQEAFARLWRGRHGVVTETAEAYAWWIVLNLASNRIRSRRPWGWLSFDDARDGRAAVGVDLVARRREQAVRSAIDALPEKLREVVLLCGYSSITQAEVAVVLGIPPGTVASRVDGVSATR